MIGVRLNTFNDNSGEPEQDANSALTELDKGLRSGKVGEQCEAIVRFPRLFEKYPFPILINSSFLKLADVFRMGNNFLRLWVLRVCQQSEKHLDKILNVDEFLRRVFSVLHSNDPVARALALRTLGAVAGIIPERQNVHHAIRRGLDSHDNVEVEAAIYATTRFAAHSNTFAVAMCNKLSDMVECESTGAERRAKLVRALRTVHGGAVRAQGVLKLLHSLLERFPSSSSVRAAITALTAIAADTVVHVPDQVDLLLSIATNDARSSVRRAALVGLKKLAEHAALWSTESIQGLVRTASDSAEASHTMLCLEVMQVLVECPAVFAGAAISPAALRSCCARADLRPAAAAAHVLTRRAVHCYEEGMPVEGADLMLALESIVIATGAPNGQNTIRPLRMALRCLQLRGHGWRRGGARPRALLEALAALAGGTHCALAVTLTDLVDGADASPDPSDDGTALVLLCTVIFQERAAKALTCKVNPIWQERVKETIASITGLEAASSAWEVAGGWGGAGAGAAGGGGGCAASCAGCGASQNTFNQLSQFLDRITCTQEQELFLPHAEAVLAAVRACCAGALWPRGVLCARACGALCRLSLTPGARGQEHAATLPSTHHLALKAEGVLLPPRPGRAAATPAQVSDALGTRASTGGGALCRLSLTPGARGQEHAATLPSTHHLALKAEGVLLPPPPSKRPPPRQVKGVQLTVTATPHPRTNEKVRAVFQFCLQY
ncbi:hypothetical protein MSG28_009503 [Choristoneura fumiferana]|uniref:Uncharacterized protein n=1 Tax=Choristoneura fumiferana TaxID=7141 RepID=A0ACC0JBG7_CHOFU|nr:hypothetical protein MSG28_009503 [Choristoneura fumiferana]